MMLATVLMVGCKQTERVIVSDLYPEFKWGFTTVNFITPVPASLQASLDFITYARQEGYSWIELRDPNASLTLEECKEIAAFARENGIEINYSVQRGLLADDFWAIFERGAANVAVFDGPKYYRTLALLGDGPEGWSAEEFARMVKVANEAAVRAAALGIRFTVENADGALDGRDKPYYGMTELMEATVPEVTLQLDTANLFTAPVDVTPEEARAFIEAFASRISYLHLKTAQDRVPIRRLDDNPLPFTDIFDLIQPHGVRYIAIELGPDDEEARIYRNITRSIEYLKDAGLIRVEKR